MSFNVNDVFIFDQINNHINNAVLSIIPLDMMLLDELKIRGKRMAQERLFMQPHMNGISNHCLLEKVLIFQI